MARQIKIPERVTITQSPALKEHPHLYEAVRILERGLNSVLDFAKSATGIDGSGGTNVVPGSYVAKDLIDFSNTGNLINVPVPPYGVGVNPPGGTGPGTGGPKPNDLGPQFDRFSDEAGALGRQMAARNIATTSSDPVAGGPQADPAASPTGIVMVVAMATYEPEFDHFEVECWLPDHSAQVGPTQSADGTFDGTAWQQTGTLKFDGLLVGSEYAFRARVVTKTSPPSLGAASVWDPQTVTWATIVVGDTTAPDPAYAPTGALVNGALKLSANPTGAPPDVAFYSIYWALWAGVPLTIPPPPTDLTPPTVKESKDAIVTLALAPRDKAEVWIRAVDTSGNRQAWTDLGEWSLGGFIVQGLLSFDNIANIFTVTPSSGGPGSGDPGVPPGFPDGKAREYLALGDEELANARLAV